MKKPILKAYYGDIFFEFLIHDIKKDSIILLSGFPSSNCMDEIIYFLHEKGFNVFVPRYKGTFQSKGEFLKTNPIIDLVEFITQLKKGRATSLWNMKNISFEIGQIFVFGGSFGGSIGCALAATSKDISKAVLATPVWDYEIHNKEFKEQDLNQLTKFVKRAFKNLYRYKFNSLPKEIKRFKEFSLPFYKKNLKTHTLVFHDPNDSAVSVEHSRRVVKYIKNIKLIETNTGHGLTIKLLDKYYPKIEAFLKIN